VVIDSFQSSLKGVLLHNGNVFASIPVAHSVHVRETCDSLKRLLTSVNCEAHGWLVCGDFRVIAFLLGLQVGYTKKSSFLCEWASWAKSEQWKKTGLATKKIFDSGVDECNTRTTGRS
jgi:hypothetical protein